MDNLVRHSSNKTSPGLARRDGKEDGKEITYHQVPQQHGDGHLPDARNIDTRPLLDGGAVKVAEAGEVDAHGAVAE